MSMLSVGLLYIVSAFSVLLIFAYVVQWIRHECDKREKAASERLLYGILSACGTDAEAQADDGFSSQDDKLKETTGKTDLRTAAAQASAAHSCAMSERPSRHFLSPHSWMPLLDAWITLSQSVHPDEVECDRIFRFFSARNADLYFIRLLRSRSVYQRCRSAFYLGFLKTTRSQKALILSLQQERKENVKLYLINALCRQEMSASLPDIIDSLKGCSRSFIIRITGLLLDFQSSFTAFFPELESRRDPELLTLIVEFARLAPYKIFSPLLLDLLRDESTEDVLRQKVFDCLMESYPYAINPADYLRHPDSGIREKAISALGNRPGKANAQLLISHAMENSERDGAIRSLSSMAKKSPPIFLYLVDTARESTDPERISLINKVLAGRLEYFLLKLGESEAEDSLYEKIIVETMTSGRMSDLVSFMNRNNDPGIENRLVDILRKNMKGHEVAADELRMYLKESALRKIGLTSLPIPQKRINEKNESVRRGPLVVAMIAILLIYPVLVAVRLAVGGVGIWSEAVRGAMNTFLAAFGWYTLAVNLFYFFLAFLAWLEAGKQSNFLRIKDDSFLFRKNILPSISILAPAYNEAMSIVSSVESLLNVNYPEFEVIVINDGSKDDTLALLIDRFKLEKTDAAYTEILHTQPVRGIYINPRTPELKVIDKINGGKADSLNVGLNAASGEYVLGIDSDSILERDALLTLTSAFLDEDKPVVASGGNIMPVNGCTVEGGVLIQKRIPRKLVPLFQTIEYLRAFMNGRMGWACLDSLMIISGAFGIFRRKNVLGINGYLTSREKYEKDTVGEDMELVVRLSRSLREQSVPHRILYNCNASCWTEVPSSIRVLKKQRDRWQRGLIDILSFHKKMFANPLYGKYGLLGFPYYLAVEVIGPWFELIGSLLFIAGIATGWISPGVFRFLLASNFIFSFALSVYSLYICDRDAPQFPVRDRLVLILSSLIETLGFRQLVSFFRITGYMGVVRKVTGWGSMIRQGFQGKRSGKS